MKSLHFVMMYLVLLVLLACGPSSYAEGARDQMPVRWVKVKFEGTQLFAQKWSEVVVKSSVSASELCAFFKVLGAFEFDKGEVIVKRKSDEGGLKSIVFPCCELVREGDGKSMLALRDGDVLFAAEPY